MRRLLSAITLSVLLSSCAADDAEVDTAARQEQQPATTVDAPEKADSPVEVVNDQQREWYEEPLLGCVEQPRDALSLAAIFESTTISVWAEVGSDDLISSLEGHAIKARDLQIFESDLERQSTVEITPFPPEAFKDLEFKTYILGISSQAGRAGIYIGVADDGAITVLGNCQNQLGDQFRSWQETAPKVRELTEVNALRELVASPELQQGVIDQWYSPATPSDPFEDWLASAPETRSLLPAEIPETVRDLYPAVIEIDFPKWWLTSDATLCAFIPDVGWNWSCISHTAADAPLVWQAFVADAGELELHLTSSDGQTSIHRLGTVDGLNGIGSSVVLTFDPEAGSIDELVRSAIPFTTTKGEIAVDSVKGVPSSAEYVDNPRPADAEADK